MKNPGKGGKTSTSKSSAAHDARKDRKSGTGLTGSPKKGGHGGKYTWAGGDGYYSHAEVGLDEAALDAKDPNFEDPDDVVEAA